MTPPRPMYVGGPSCETANWIIQTTRKTSSELNARRREYATSDITAIVRPLPPFRRLIRRLVGYIRFELFGDDQIAFGEVEWNEEKQELRRRDRPSE
jgi:hypothetical protein